MPQVPPLHPILETRSNLIAEGTELEGKITFDVITRFHGRLKGTLYGTAKIILGESAYIEGEIHAETLLVSGYVKGNIRADTKIVLSSAARVFGDIQAPSIAIEAGAVFEGRSKIIEKPTRAILDPLPSPA